MSTKQICRWHFTLHGEDVVERVETVKENLGLLCGRWVFQLEKGEETGKLHLQGRLSLKQARRVSEMQKVIKGAHFSPEAGSELEGNFYCMKDGTRVDGPWSDKDKKTPLPWDLAMIKEWKEWQVAVFESLKEKDDRVINVLVDEVGGIGKSKVFKMCLYKKLAGLIPVIGDAKDIIQAVCSMGEREAYIVDLPRCGESDGHLRSIYKAIEQIKNGIVMDFRYSYKELIMGSPVIWVFTNEMPAAHYLSRDRWRLWRVVEGKLVRMGAGGSGVGAAL